MLVTRVELLRNSNVTDSLKASSFEQIIRERCSKESLSGICDTILVVPCRDAGRKIHEAVFHKLCAMKPGSAREIFDESVTLMEDFQLIFCPAPERPGEQQADCLVVPDVKPKFEAKRNKDSGLQPPSSTALKGWPKVAVPHDAAARMKSTLNLLFTDHSTPDGSPKPLHIAEASDLKDQQGASTLVEDTFKYLLAQYRMLPKAHHFGNDFLLDLFFVEYKKAGDSTVHKATNQARMYAAAALASSSCLESLISQYTCSSQMVIKEHCPWP